MSTKTDVMIVGGVALALLAAAWYAKKQAGRVVADAEQALGDAWANVKSGAAVEAVFGAANDAVVGTVTGVSKGIGLPTPAETITDAQACKFWMDENGVLSASAHCSAPAFAKALLM